MTPTYPFGAAIQTLMQNYFKSCGKRQLALRGTGRWNMCGLGPPIFASAATQDRKRNWGNFHLEETALYSKFSESRGWRGAAWKWVCRGNFCGLLVTRVPTRAAGQHWCVPGLEVPHSGHILHWEDMAPKLCSESLRWYFLLFFRQK